MGVGKAMVKFHLVTCNLCLHNMYCCGLTGIIGHKIHTQDCRKVANDWMRCKKCYTFMVLISIVTWNPRSSHVTCIRGNFNTTTICGFQTYNVYVLTGKFRLSACEEIPGGYGWSTDDSIRIFLPATTCSKCMDCWPSQLLLRVEVMAHNDSQKSYG